MIFFPGRGSARQITVATPDLTSLLVKLEAIERKLDLLLPTPDEPVLFIPDVQLVKANIRGIEAAPAVIDDSAVEGLRRAKGK